MSSDFVHLHAHSEYSLLDGLGHVGNLVAEAKRLGQPALALTDHGSMHGTIEFFRAAKSAGIKPIVGVEAYQTVWNRPMDGRDSQLDRHNRHLLLLAKNMTGYRNLLKITSDAHLKGYYYRPRVDHEYLAAHAEGLIATTGCLGAEIPQLITQGKEQEAYDRLGWYIDVFGKENFFLELQPHEIADQVNVNKVLVPWSEKFGIGMIATNDVHYVHEEDTVPHDVLLCVQTGTTVDETNRMSMADFHLFLKSREQMEASFKQQADLPDSIFTNTLLIAEMCNVDLDDNTYHLPDLPIPEGYTYETYLRELTEDGLKRFYGDQAEDPEVQERKERELRIIHEMGFDAYFLIVADLCDYARKRNIWWNVRGSGAGSVVAYCTGITGLDPLKNNLIFERFLNPGRVNMPDFDLDFPDDQREEMIRYTVEKYGEDQVAQIVTFGRMKARAAIRDVGRAKGLALDEVDYLAKLIPAIPGEPVTIQGVLEPDNEFYNPDLVKSYSDNAKARDLLDTSMKLEGVPRHSSVHAAAVIVADRELTYYTPLMRGNKNTITSTITQYEFPILESIGLLKVDFLGLSTLSVMREAANLINERHDTAFNLTNIPFEGEEASEAFKLLSSGEVSGVFQVEGQGMRRVLTEMQPNTFEHIVATISLYRPGPMEYIPQFIRRLHGEEEVEFKHPLLEPILAETFGIIVYQEQIIQILSELAGYTPGEADLVRRAVGKKKEKDIATHQQLFIDGCIKNGIKKSVAEEIYADIMFFARYGFNKSHAADYAVITVQTAYLKALYPVEYMAALLLIEHDKTDKVINFIQESRRMGIAVLPPDVNYSGMDFDIQDVPEEEESHALRDSGLAYNFPVPEDSAIRFGMAAVKNVGEGPVSVILAAREEGGPFTSLEDFCDRVDLRQVNKRALECLIKVGALDRFGHRSQLLDSVENMIGQSASTHNAREAGQLSMFELMEDMGGDQVAPIHLPNIEPESGRERLEWEKELLGVYAMSHPLQHISVDIKNIVTCQCNELDARYDGKNVTLVGMISSVRPIMTKKGDRMAFMQIEDMQGQCEVVVFPRTFEEYGHLLEPDSIVVVKGKAQTREGQTSLLADNIRNYVDFAQSAQNNRDEYQKPLMDITPTINGARAEKIVNGNYDNGNNGNGNNGLNGHGADTDDLDGAYDDAPPPMEESPFRHDSPPWHEEPAGTNQADSIKKTGESTSEPADKAKAEGFAKSAHKNNDHSADDDSTDELLNTDSAEVKAQYDSVEESTNNENRIAEDMPELSSSPQQETANPSPAEAAPESTPQLEEGHHKKDNDGKENDRREPTAVNDIANGQSHENRDDTSQDGPTSQQPASEPKREGAPSSHRTGNRTLRVIFRATGELERDKYRVNQICEYLRDPKGRDEYQLTIQSGSEIVTLAFPEESCTITERLLKELDSRYRVDAEVVTN